MHTLQLKNFRCFSYTGPVPIRPLTILVGENSSGKTSFLAAVRLAWDIANGPRYDFNEEPFLLGAYDQIAHYRGGKGGRASEFEIASTHQVRVRGAERLRDIEYKAEFRRSGFYPTLTRQTISGGNDFVSVSTPPTTDQPLGIEILINGVSREDELLDRETRFFLSRDTALNWRHIAGLLGSVRALRKETIMSKLSDTDQTALAQLLDSAATRRLRRPVAIAPVRTRPLRTYNPVSDTPLPEGEHIPMVLATTFFEDKAQWVKLKASLDKFGEASGLFSSLEIKGLGRHEGDPFQIRLKIAGPRSNLVDVGYGVSQVLPILVEALLADRGDIFLLQQPEVHLHPKAQAELGTFLVELAVNQRIQFVVETHSDYLIDRLRIAIRKEKTISASQVSILFFERKGVESVIHPIELDDVGNLVDPPKRYRQFFFDEERKLFGV